MVKIESCQKEICADWSLIKVFINTCASNNAKANIDKHKIYEYSLKMNEKAKN